MRQMERKQSNKHLTISEEGGKKNEEHTDIDIAVTVTSINRAEVIISMDNSANAGLAA